MKNGLKRPKSKRRQKGFDLRKMEKSDPFIARASVKPIKKTKPNH